ncbi:T9SS type B sorting domain-containing protein [Bizionia sp.]|uniref:T9SS type B sorting domain-containing protein n=1 Tax=Bizionia sp. TaxID=1954480 RepID=UPI003A8DD697
MKKMKFILGCFFTILCFQAYAQESNDCVGSITVCGNGTFMSNTTGSGNEFEINSCGGFEHNSLWLQINIVQSGTLGFDLIPNDPDINVDYDFWVYGPNVACNNLGNPIRCSTTNPNLAGLANNHTGINGSTTLTQTGPGDNGNGYVYWLTVTAGESYYIAVDRPHGDGGFEIQWTGTAMDGAGAFPSPPDATPIDDVVQCSGTPDVSIFDLNAIKSTINPDLVNNSIEFYGSIADATDEVNPLGGGFGIYANTQNPEQVYARVTSGSNDCYSLIDFNLVVSPIPDATVTSSDTVVCEGDSVNFTITGTPNATINYNFNNGATEQVLLDVNGEAVVSEVLTVDTDINLTEAEVINGSGQVVCSQILIDSASVTVNPSVTPVFTQVADICDGEALPPLPTTSDNGVTGTWSPAIDNTTTTTYTFTPDAGQCALTETMTITVNPSVTPTFTQVADVCDGDALPPLPTTSDNGVTGTWSPAIDNTATTTYTFTPDAGQCAVTETMTITVNPSVTPVFTQVADICEGDALPPLPTTSDNGVTGTWSPAIDNTATTTYTFTPDVGQCAVTETMTITVNPSVTPVFTQVADICEGDALPPLPTTSDNGVTGTWSPAIDNTTTTTYTFTPDAGQCAVAETMTITVNPSVMPVFTQVADICEGNALPALPTTSDNGVTGTWSPAIDNTTTTTYTFTPDAGQCAVAETMTIIVNPSVTPVFTQVGDICEGDALPPLPTTSDNGVTGTWSPAIDNTATTTYTFTPDAGQCAVAETMTIIVNPSVTPVFTQVADICEGDALAPLPTTSNNGVTGTWSPAMNNSTTTTYTFTPDAGQCGAMVTMSITVHELPSISLDTLSVCGSSNTGYDLFDLTSEIPSILGAGQSQADFTVDFYEDSAMTSQIITNPYPNTAAYNQTIFVYITNINSGCSELFPFELNVFEAANATQPDPVIICDSDGVNDGVSTYDLSVLDAEVLNGLNPNDFSVNYYFSAQDAIDNNDAILDLANFQNTVPNNQTIHIRVSNNAIPTECYGLTSVEISVNPILNPEIYSLDGSNTLCVDYESNVLQNEVTLVSDIQGANYTYTWYLNGVEIAGANQGTYVVNTVSPGLYTVLITETLPTANCPSSISEPFEVIQSGQAVLVNVSQTGTFDPNPSVTVTVEGYGVYWFQMDNGPILDNNGVFTNVSGGLHTVYVYDRKTENPSCGFITIEDIRIIDYPKIITPNHDGDNDTWNVYAFRNQPNATINIYDRYGKVLANIKPSGPGWDGTYKGSNLPSSDYWFVLSYEEDGQPKQFRSHFSLKR